MPVIVEKRTIHTKVRELIDGAQGVLLEMYQNPENVHQVYVEDTQLYVLIDRYYGELKKEAPQPVKYHLGSIKKEYSQYLGSDRKIVTQWRITGGQELEGYNGRCTNFGMNITLYF